jgi:hypothetical protein
MTGKANDFLYAGLRTQSGHGIRIKLALPGLTESSILGTTLPATNVFHSSHYSREDGDHVTVTTCKTIIKILPFI